MGLKVIPGNVPMGILILPSMKAIIGITTSLSLTYLRAIAPLRST